MNDSQFVPLTRRHGLNRNESEKKEYNKRLFVSLLRLDNFGLSCSTIVELPKKVYNIFYLAFACTFPTNADLGMEKKVFLFTLGTKIK